MVLVDALRDHCILLLVRQQPEHAVGHWARFTLSPVGPLRWNSDRSLHIVDMGYKNIQSQKYVILSGIYVKFPRKYANSADRIVKFTTRQSDFLRATSPERNGQSGLRTWACGRTKKGPNLTRTPRRCHELPFRPERKDEIHREALFNFSRTISIFFLIKACRWAPWRPIRHRDCVRRNYGRSACAGSLPANSASSHATRSPSHLKTKRHFFQARMHAQKKGPKQKANTFLRQDDHDVLLALSQDALMLGINSHGHRHLDVD